MYRIVRDPPQSLPQPRKPPFGRDGPGLFFFSDLTALVNVSAHSHCVSLSTYWQDRLKWEISLFSDTDAEATPEMGLQPTPGFRRTPLVCSAAPA